MTAHLVVHLILTLFFTELFHIIQATNKNIKSNRQDVKDKSSSEKNDRDKTVFHINPDDNAHLQFNYYRQNGKDPTTSTGKKKKQPEYHLNFDFNNYRNPKTPKARESLSNKVKMRRNRKRLLPNGRTNPYNYFPLKGEDM